MHSVRGGGDPRAQRRPARHARWTSGLAAQASTGGLRLTPPSAHTATSARQKTGDRESSRRRSGWEIRSSFQTSQRHASDNLTLENRENDKNRDGGDTCSGHYQLPTRAGLTIRE